MRAGLILPIALAALAFSQPGAADEIVPMPPAPPCSGAGVIACLKQRVEAGSAAAMLDLADAYFRGDLVAHDAAEGRRLTLLAFARAKAGPSDMPYGAYACAGSCTLYAPDLGEVVTIPMQVYRRWGPDPADLRAAADRGDARAMLRLGYAYAEGELVWDLAANEAEAIGWWRKALERGQADAAFPLAELYLQGGKQTPKDPAAAAALYRQAADAGDPQAMEQLSRLYAEGMGVARDRAAARRWCRAAGVKLRAGYDVPLGTSTLHYNPRKPDC